MESTVLVMQGLVKRAKNHLTHNNMSYVGHFLFASKHGLICIKAGILLLVHSILPCFFEKAGSRLIHRLEKVFTERENKINESKSNI